jgi:hypothetical protein
MSHSPNENRCHRCGGETETGFLTAIGLIGPITMKPKLTLVIPGEATAMNPVTAFKQGVKGAKEHEAYLLCGRRCAACGSVELIATERTSWLPAESWEQLD